jgi:hypothetical protein
MMVVTRYKYSFDTKLASGLLAIYIAMMFIIPLTMLSGLFLALYGFAMILVGVTLTLLFIVLHKTGWRVKNAVDSIIYYVKHWHEIRRYL